MQTTHARHDRQHGSRRRTRTPVRSGIVALALLFPLAGAGCGDEPLVPHLGDAYQLDATAREVYDCSPNSEGTIDQTICGTRADTVELETHGRIVGQLAITAIDTVESRRRQGTRAGAADTAGQEVIEVEGELEETTCTPDCAVRTDVRSGYLYRTPTACTSGTALRACDGRLGDTVIVVDLFVPDMDPLFGPFLAGSEVTVGRTDEEYVQFGLFGPQLGPPPRWGTRYHLSLVRERHFLGSATVP